MKLTHTISLIEVLWTLFTAIGLYYNSKILLRSVGDYQAVKLAKQNHMREYSARLTVWTYGTWTFVQFVFVITGAIAMTVPAPTPNGQPATITYVITAAFIMCSFLLAMSSYIVESGREKLIAMIEKGEI